ncbi:MAG: (Fe-S)-binding protein [Dehalococcoidia bacterium]|nr:(Fe-S)-binding protein [Dehalococcoidia bacterium]
MKEIKRIAADTKAYGCLDCGKCTAVCPVSRYDCDFSPRMLVYDALHGGESEVLKDGQIWSCLTCAACEKVCQSGVRYSDFVRSLRADAYEIGKTGQCTHGGALQSLMRIMASDDLKQDRLGWVVKQLQIADTSDVFYFVGCAPYFDTFFSDLDVKTLRAAKGSVAILNHLGIVPALSPDERCCGHDLLNIGDVEGFVNLARHNIAAIAKTGAKRVVVSCAEGYHTLKVEYPRLLGNTGFEVVHMTELIAEAVKNGKLKFNSVNRKVTFHDPCRLGRMSGIYDAPRSILQAIPGLEVVEMNHHRSMAVCCGTQSWINCGATNKQIQLELLREAKATGADMLLTACPKCKIHLTCAMNDEKLGQELQIEIEDISRFAASALWPGRKFIS